MEAAVIPVAEAARARGINLRQLQILCKRSRVPGARLVGRLWMLPPDFTITPGSRGPKMRKG